MAFHRNLILLLSIAFIPSGFNELYGQTQNGNPSSNAILGAPWLQSSPRFAEKDAQTSHVSVVGWPYEQREIDSARRAAIRYASNSSSNSAVLSKLATENASFASQWVELAEKINALSVRVLNATAKLDSATRDFDDVGLKLRQHGLTPTIGLLLSHKKIQLEDWQVDGAAGHLVNDEIKRSRSKQLENGIVQFDGRDPLRQTSEILASAGIEPTNVEYASLASQVQSLLRERSQWLPMLTRGYDDYRQKLGELDSASTLLEKLIENYRQRIHRHVTWIRSVDPIDIADVRKFRTGLSSLFDSRRSSDFGFAIKQKWSNNPTSGLTLLGAILIILLLRVLMLFWLTSIGRRKRMRTASDNARKCVASLLTPLIALAIPSILFLTARWLGTGFVTHSLLHASSSLYAASLVALIVEVPRQLLRTDGFLEKHLKIELPRRQRALTYLQVIGTGLVLFSYFITLAELVDHGTLSGSVARIGFIVSLLLVAWTAHLSLKPTGGFLEPLFERFGGTCSIESESYFTYSASAFFLR